MKPVSAEYTDIEHFDRVKTWKDGKVPAWMEVALDKARANGLCQSVRDIDIARSIANKAEATALLALYEKIEYKLDECMKLAEGLD